MRIRSGLVGLAMLLGVAARAHSAALLHELFQDHAVLQRDKPIPVWGQAAANERVSVSLGSHHGSRPSGMPPDAGGSRCLQWLPVDPSC